MNLDKSLEELRNEAVPDSALPQALSTLRRPSPRRSLWLLPTTLTSLAILAALWPKAHTDEAWASALKALKDAKLLHIQFKKQYQTIDAWKAGSKMRWLTGVSKHRPDGFAELRFNGTQVSQRIGFLTSVKVEPKLTSFAGGLELWAFDTAETKIEGKEVTPKTVHVNGKTLLAYRFAFGDVFDGEPPDRKRKADRLHPPSHHIGSQVVTAFVDPNTDRITELDQGLDFDTDFPVRERAIFQMDGFKAAVDYPSTIDGSMFDPPSDAFDTEQSKREVVKLLAGSEGTAETAGQKVDLKALFCDGVNLYAVWTGCPCDYDDPHRFLVDGVDYGPSWREMEMPIRGFSSAKVVRAATASNPYCIMIEAATKPLADKVELTLPVFAPDTSRPYQEKKLHKLFGYHSREVGTVQFHDVPVTPIKPIDNYERQLGELNKLW